MKQETKEYTLKFPFDMEVTENDETKTVTVEKVTITPPKGTPLRKITRLVAKSQIDPTEYGEGDLIMDCIQLMSDMPEGGIDEAEAVDVRGLGDLAGPFLEAVMGGGPSSANSPSGSAKTKPK